MDFITIIGILAGFLTTIAFLPQILKSWKTKKTNDISIGMMLLMMIGIFLWTIYGFAINDFPLILTNIVSLILNVIQILLIIRYGR